MKSHRFLVILLALALSAQLLIAQSKIVIPAGTPEDQALQEITNQPDAQKRTSMYEEFVQKFSSSPAAVAYGNWQLAQAYGAAGDLPKALSYGDKALAAMPDVVEILVSQIDFAQQAKDSAKVVDYAVRGATVINNLDKTPKPADVAAETFANDIAAQKEALKSSYQYLEVAGYNAITGENDARKRMPEIEKYLTAFPGSQFAEPLVTLAVVTLQENKDSAGLAAFGDRMLARNPDDLRLLVLLANAFAGDASRATKAASYARRALELQKGKSAEASPTDRKLAGVAHSALGRALLQEGKFPAAATELKAATALLHDSPDDLAGAWYFLGFAYAKMERAADATNAFTQAGNIAGPYQQPAQDALAKIKAARSKK